MDNNVKYANNFYVTLSEEEALICFKHCHRTINGDVGEREYSDLPLQYDDVVSVAMHPNRAKELAEIIENLMKASRSE